MNGERRCRNLPKMFVFGAFVMCVSWHCDTSIGVGAVTLDPFLMIDLNTPPLWLELCPEMTGILRSSLVYLLFLSPNKDLVKTWIFSFWKASSSTHYHMKPVTSHYEELWTIVDNVFMFYIIFYSLLLNVIELNLQPLWIISFSCWLYLWIRDFILFSVQTFELSDEQNKTLTSSCWALWSCVGYLIHKMLLWRSYKYSTTQHKPFHFLLVDYIYFHELLHKLLCLMTDSLDFHHEEGARAQTWGGNASRHAVDCGLSLAVGWGWIGLHMLMAFTVTLSLCQPSFAQPTPHCKLSNTQ